MSELDIDRFRGADTTLFREDIAQSLIDVLNISGYAKLRLHLSRK